MSPYVRHYLATDQAYVRRLFLENVAENIHVNKNANKGRGGAKNTTTKSDNVTFTPLDWESDIPSSSLKKSTTTSSNDQDDPGFDMLVSCDCIYNESLTKPFLSTCAEICRLRSNNNRPTICLIAQRLRSPDVFETWLREALHDFGFRVYRIKDCVLPDSLRDGSGSVVHLMVLA